MATEAAASDAARSSPASSGLPVGAFGPSVLRSAGANPRLLQAAGLRSPAAQQTTDSTGAHAPHAAYALHAAALSERSPSQLSAAPRMLSGGSGGSLTDRGLRRSHQQRVDGDGDVDASAEAEAHDGGGASSVDATLTPAEGGGGAGGGAGGSADGSADGSAGGSADGSADGSVRSSADGLGALADGGLYLLNDRRSSSCASSSCGSVADGRRSDSSSFRTGSFKLETSGAILSTNGENAGGSRLMSRAPAMSHCTQPDDPVADDDDACEVGRGRGGDGLRWTGSPREAD
eukprot:2174903-Pleurochrysis_carterae.AAC.1